MLLSMLQDPQVFASALEGGLNVIATAIPSGVGLVLSRRYFSKKKLEQACLNAYYELQFMQEVEVQANGEMSKVALRKAAREHSSFDSNGLFTPSALKKKIRSMEGRVESDSPYWL